MTSTMHKDILFNLSISYPESIFGCRLPRTLKGNIIQIKYFNRDYFENYSSIIVEETVIRDGYNEFFIFRYTSSEDLLVTCSSSESNYNEINYKEDFKIVQKVYKEENSGRIDKTGVIVIIVVGVLAFFVIIIFYICLRRRNNHFKILDNIDRKTVSSGTFGSSSSSTYY